MTAIDDQRRTQLGPTAVSVDLRWMTAGIVGCTLLAAGLRFYQLSAQSFWTDEILSIVTAQTALSRIAKQSEVSSSLPTFFFILRFFVGESGNPTELAGRLLSVLAGVLSVPLLAMLVFTLRHNMRETVVTAFFLAVNPLHLWYSQDIRAYALMLCAGLAAWLFFEKAVRIRRRALWAGYVVLSAFTIALHKTGIVFPFLCGSLSVLNLAARKLKPDEGIAQALVAVIAITLVAIYPSAYSVDRPSTPLEVGYTFLTYLGGYSFGPSVNELQTFGTVGAIERNIGQLGMAAAVGLAVLALMLRCFRIIRRMREFYLILLSIGLVFVLSLVSKFAFNVRYTLPGLLGFIALLSHVALTRRTLGTIVLVLVLAVNAAAIAQWYSVKKYGKDDIRSVSQWITAHSGSFRQAMVQPDYLGESLKWYVGDEEITQRISGSLSISTIDGEKWPDLLIMGRKHHVPEYDENVRRFQEKWGQVDSISQFHGFQIFHAKIQDLKTNN